MRINPGISMISATEPSPRMVAPETAVHAPEVGFQTLDHHLLLAQQLIHEDAAFWPSPSTTTSSESQLVRSSVSADIEHPVQADHGMYSSRSGRPQPCRPPRLMDSGLACMDSMMETRGMM
jgi:hypothetical protein